MIKPASKFVHAVGANEEAAQKNLKGKKKSAFYSSVFSGKRRNKSDSCLFVLVL